MKNLFMALLILSMFGCATDNTRHKDFYAAIKGVAEQQRQERVDEMRMKMEFLKAMFACPVYTSVVSTPPQNTNRDLVKIMAAMMIFNDHDDPRRLQYALSRIPKPAPTIGERVSDGVFRVLPVALGISAAAYGGYLINKASELGATTFVTNQPGSNSSVTTTTNENYKVNSDNTQTATSTQGNTGAGGSGGPATSSGNQGNSSVIGQGMTFEANNPAMRSTGYQAPYNPVPEITPPIEIQPIP